MSTVREVKKRLLIIEPDAEKRQLLSTYFLKSYECAETGTVESAIELSQRAECRLLFLTPDSSLPLSDSLSLSRAP